MFEDLINQVLTMHEAVLKEDKLFQNMAKLQRKYYEALQKEGFSTDEALKIVVAQGDFLKMSK